MTTTTNKLDALHGWLFHMRRYGPQTAYEIWGELCGLRAGGITYPDLPANPAELDASLKALAVAGKAVNEGDGWVWSERREKALF